MKMSIANAGAARAFILCTAILCSCSGKEKMPDVRPEQKTLTFSFRTRAIGENAYHDVPSEITMYGYSAGSLYGPLKLVPENGRASVQSAPEASLYFLSGAEANTVAGMDETSFLNGKVSFSGADGPADYLTGTVKLPSTLSSLTDVSVEMEHGTARIDLNTGQDSTTVVKSIQIENAPSESYIFPSSVSRAALEGRTSYIKEFEGEGMTSGFAAGVAYCYESETPVKAVISCSQKGVPLRLSVDIPSIERGKAYEVQVLNIGAEINVLFSVKEWEDGLTVYAQPDADGRILLDETYSVIPDGVQADYEANVVNVPYTGASEMKLVFAAPFRVEISSVKGLNGTAAVGEASYSEAEDGRVLTSVSVSIPDQGKGRLGYSIVLGLKNPLLENTYDYLEVRVAPSAKVLETVDIAGRTWMAFNATGSDLDSDPIYLSDDLQSVEAMYRENWRVSAGCFYLHGSPYKYDIYTRYDPIPAKGAIDNQNGWNTDFEDSAYLPCPEGYRVPTRNELNALLPDGARIPGEYTAGNGDKITSEIVEASSMTGDNKAARYLKLTSAASGQSMFIPFAGVKNDKEKVANPRNSGTGIYLWSGERLNAAGGMAFTKRVLLSSDGKTASVAVESRARQSFASVRCIKK